MKLIDNWQSAWRWFSVQALAIIMALPIVWAGLPDDVKAMVPDGWELYIFMIVAAGGLAGRLIAQPDAGK